MPSTASGCHDRDRCPRRARGELGEDESTAEPAGLTQATARDAQPLLGNARLALREGRSSVGADRSVAGRGLIPVKKILTELRRNCMELFRLLGNVGSRIMRGGGRERQRTVAATTVLQRVATW